MVNVATLKVMANETYAQVLDWWSGPKYLQNGQPEANLKHLTQIHEKNCSALLPSSKYNSSTVTTNKVAVGALALLESLTEIIGVGELIQIVNAWNTDTTSFCKTYHPNNLHYCFESPFFTKFSGLQYQVLNSVLGITVPVVAMLRYVAKLKKKEYAKEALFSSLLLNYDQTANSLKKAFSQAEFKQDSVTQGKCKETARKIRDNLPIIREQIAECQGALTTAQQAEIIGKIESAVTAVLKTQAVQKKS